MMNIDPIFDTLEGFAQRQSLLDQFADRLKETGDWQNVHTQKQISAELGINSLTSTENEYIVNKITK